MRDVLSKNINIPSDIKNFKKVINTSLQLLEDAGHNNYFSPFSVIPIIEQALGLNIPSMGGGDSPYSIKSIIFQSKNKTKLPDETFLISLIEKRRIINEIYEMIGPYLLEEENDYIDLLINIKYRYLIKDSKQKTREFQKTLKEKFFILSNLINKFNNKNGDFGYIIHYGCPGDLYREYDFLENLPEHLATEWRNRSYPTVNEIFINNFPTTNFKTKKCVKGWVLFISNYTKELFEDGRLRKRKILQAVKLAEKLGVKIIGMGGLIAAQGSYGLSQEIKDVGFATGHAYSIGNIMEIMENCIDRLNLDMRACIVAIVGAASSIGSGCARLLSEKGIKQLILVDLSTFISHKKLNELKAFIQDVDPSIKVEISMTLSDIRKADVVVCATNSPTSLISSKYLKKGAIAIDDSFPRNITKQSLRDRNDIILLEGGIVQLPLTVDIYFARNMPDLMDMPFTRLISCKETYGCFAETLVLALYYYKKDYGLGYADPKLVKDIMLKAKRVGFSSAPFKCFNEAVEDERFMVFTSGSLEPMYKHKELR